ncbi:MAG: hypothetical protein WC307_00490 [Candidatus Nanoarchaeia archaeon]|jgi:hypothetical protein
MKLLILIHPGYSGDLLKEELTNKWTFKINKNLKGSYKRYLTNVKKALKEYDSLVFTSKEAESETKAWLSKVKPKKTELIITPRGDPVPMSITNDYNKQEQAAKQLNDFINKHLKDKELLFAGELLLKSRKYDSCVEGAYNLFIKGIMSYRKGNKWVNKKIKVPKLTGTLLYEACFPNKKVVEVKK